MPTATGNVNTSSIFHKLKNLRNSLPRTNKQKSYFSPAHLSGGGGAPIRSSSGKLLVPLRDDPDISFRDSTRNHVDIDLRYKRTPSEQRAYKQELDVQVDEHRRNRMNERYGSSVPRYNNSSSDEPWGRPGPGGAPWRDPRFVGANFMKSMGWTTKNTLQDIHKDINEHTVKVEPKSPERPTQNSPTKYNCCNVCTCECGKKAESKYLTNPKPIEHPENELPKISQQHRSQPHYQRPLECNRHMDPEIQAVPVQPQSSKPKPKVPSKKPSRTCLITGGVELVPLLAKRRDDRPISLSTTDITKYKINKSSWNDGGVEYLNDLDRQVAQKRMSREMSREREIETSNRHFTTWESFWGRPGGGAPTNNRNKYNLDDLLYNTPMYHIY